jgi:chromosome partitioning protein
MHRLDDPQSLERSEGFSMDVIVLATRKGGSGKSTLAIGLALAAKHDGHIVRLIETDPQGTLSNWQSRRGVAEPLVEPVYRAEDIESRLQSLGRGGVTLAIIDTAGGQSDATTAAIRACDLCLIPARPSVADIEAGASTLGTVRAFGKPFAFVLNQTPIRGQRIDYAATALGGNTTIDIADVLAQPFVAMRNDHQDALRAGLAVSEYAPSGKSAGEISRLWQWVAARLNSSPAHEVPGGEATPFPILLQPLAVQDKASTPETYPLPAWDESNDSWDACL